MHDVHDGIIELDNFEGELLGFGSNSSNSSMVSSSAGDHHKVEKLGEITMEVRSCKKTKTFEAERPRWNEGISAIDENSKEINNFEMQSTKWKTVSAGTFYKRNKHERCYNVEYGDL